MLTINLIGQIHELASNLQLCVHRWWLEIDGSPCSNYEDISTSIRSSTAQDIFAPTTITGFCNESALLPISTGSHSIRLMVGNCPGATIVNAAGGFFSTSRLIVEEIPLRECVAGSMTCIHFGQEFLVPLKAHHIIAEQYSRPSLAWDQYHSD